MKIPPDNSYRTFCHLTSGYRMFCVISEAVNSGIILQNCAVSSVEYAHDT